MSEIEERAAQQSACRDPQEIVHAYGNSSLGNFLAAVDRQGLCAVMFGDEHVALLESLCQVFPDRNHRLQERDGTSPAYRWGEARRQALLAREAAPREPVRRDRQQSDNFWPL